MGASNSIFTHTGAPLNHGQGQQQLLAPTPSSFATPMVSSGGGGDAAQHATQHTAAVAATLFDTPGMGETPQGSAPFVVRRWVMAKSGVAHMEQSVLRRFLLLMVEADGLEDVRVQYCGCKRLTGATLFSCQSLLAFPCTSASSQRRRLTMAAQSLDCNSRKECKGGGWCAPRLLISLSLSIRQASHSCACLRGYWFVCCNTRIAILSLECKHGPPAKPQLSPLTKVGVSMCLNRANTHLVR